MCCALDALRAPHSRASASAAPRFAGDMWQPSLSAEYERELSDADDDPERDCCDRNIECSSLVYFWSSRVALIVHIALSGGVAGVAGASYYFCYGSSTSPLTLGIVGVLGLVIGVAGLVAFPMKSKAWLQIFLYGLLLDALAMFVGAFICYATIVDAQNDLADRWRSGVSTEVIPFTSLQDNQQLVFSLLLSLATIAMADVAVQLALTLWLWVQLYRLAEATARESVVGGNGVVASIFAVSSQFRGEFILSTVTFCANLANDLTCPPSYIIM